MDPYVQEHLDSARKSCNIEDIMLLQCQACTTDNLVCLPTLLIASQSDILHRYSVDLSNLGCRLANVGIFAVL